MPAAKSRYSRPASSKSRVPSPSTNVTRVGGYVGSRAVSTRDAHATHRRDADVRGDAVPRRERRGEELRDDAAVEDAAVDERLRAMRVDRVDELAVAIDAGHVGEEADPRRADADGERGRHLVGVHVQRAARERRDDRDAAGRERVEHRRRRTRERPADEPELRQLLRLEPDLVACERQRERADRRADGCADRGEALAHDLEPGRRRHPASADEVTSRPRRSISSEICGPAPCTTHTGSSSAAIAAATPPVDAPPTFRHDHVRYSALIFT